MPGLPPGDHIPGTALPGSGYPQWGVTGNVGDNASWKIIKADNESQKIADLRVGYAPWFTSEESAQAFINSEKSIFNGTLPGPLSGLDAIGHALDAIWRALTDIYMWRSLAWIILGVLLLVLGLALWLKQATPIGKLL